MNKLPDDFDYNFYKNVHKDLNNFTNDQLKKHYLNFGYKEGRIYKLPDDFDYNLYKNIHEDLSNFSNDQLKEHYLKNGYKEGRIYKLPDNFDHKFYKNVYKDLCDFSNDQLKEHYLKHGYKEGRIYNLPDDFNPSIYKNLHNDLKDLDDKTLINHFINCGIREKRAYKNANAKIDIKKNINLNEFSFKNKPSNWNSLPLFRKIGFTQSRLGKIFSPFVDKLQAKEKAKIICGDKIEVPKTIRILKDYNDINENDLNSNYIIKSAHASNFNINIKPNVKYNINEIKEKLKSWNILFHPKLEVQYSYLTPTFFIEEKIEDKYYGKNGDAVCYMIRCIHGIPYTFNPSTKIRGLEQRYYIFDNNKKLTELNIDYKALGKNFFNIDINKLGQKNIERMYDIACLLSKQFEFVRIDLYIDKNDKIYLSEFTFTPSGGGQNYPIDIEMKLGKLWK